MPRIVAKAGIGPVGEVPMDPALATYNNAMCPVLTVQIVRKFVHPGIDIGDDGDNLSQICRLVDRPRVFP